MSTLTPVRGFRFWAITAAAVVAAGATFSLGQWQLSRAAEKEALQAAVDTQNRLAALDTAAVRTATLPDTLVHRRVRLRGSWVPDATVFLDNRQMNAKAGFFVMTPLRLEGGDAALLVQRGWVQRNFIDRTALPRIHTPAGSVELDGHIAPPPSKLYAFKGQDTGAIRQNLDLAAFGAETKLALLPVTLVQTGPAGDGLQRDWFEAGAGTAKHYGYAFQWFGLCGLIVILYVWFQIVRRHYRRPA